MPIRTWLLTVLALASVVTSCDGSTPDSRPPTGPHPTAAASGASPTTPHAPPSSSPATPASFTPAAQRCGIAAPVLQDHVIHAPKGSRLPAATVGRGSTVAIFLHETGYSGYCGWMPFAAWATRHYKFRALMFDLCGYGESDCPSAVVNPVAQVRAAAVWARHRGADRVVIVGASMGGAIAPAAALAVHADAVVDLSGPLRWEDIDVRKITPKLTMPTLFAIARGDPYSKYAAFRAAFERVPAQARFVTAPSGHGWEMLMNLLPPHRPKTLAVVVARWVVGGYG
jgi:pimeloyl-ACP methyl ester carboxylesterase